MPVYATIIGGPLDGERVPVRVGQDLVDIRLNASDKGGKHSVYRVAVLRDAHEHRLLTYCYPRTTSKEEAEKQAVAIYHERIERTL